MGSLILHSKKFGTKEVLYDEVDHELISSFTWYLFSGTNNKTCYVRGINGRDTFFLHRKILRIEDPKIKVDHINGNGLDNRRSNIRLSSHAQNSRNRGISKNNTSGFKGVSVISGVKKIYYKANIEFNYKKMHIGQYDTILEAIEAYNKKAIELYGEFARLNSFLHCNPNTNPHFRVINSCDTIDSGNYVYSESSHTAVRKDL